METPANLGGVADPRLSAEPDAIASYHYDENTGRPIYRKNRSAQIYDPAISFEEYHYFASIEREYEKTLPADKGLSSVWKTMIGYLKGRREAEKDRTIRTGQIISMPEAESEPERNADEADSQKSSKEKYGRDEENRSGPAQSSKENFGKDEANRVNSASPPVSDEEWHTASRAARTATWGAVFYLITTDILGPFSVPWSLSQLGYGPGAALYAVFGFMAFFSGLQLHNQFLGLDSEKYPVKNYGDLAYRIFGGWARHVVNVLQSLQFFLNVTLLIVSKGQGLAQLAKGPSGNGFLCFVVAQVIFLACGALLGQIRTLQRLSYLANIAVWMNVFILIMTMVITNTSEPNWDAVKASYGIEEGPIYHTAKIPDGKGLTDQINGLMQSVYSYGGATLFNELMAEMRRPRDFWKGLILADLFIFSCYIIFGMVVYSAQGQGTFNPAYQGINPYAWQTVGNVFALITGLIAATLYGNIGIKVLYANVGREFLHFPPLEERGGKFIWIAFVPIYWALAFVLAAAVPQISYLGSFVGAAMILQFTYTFPPILMIGYNVLKDSMIDEDVFVPATGELHRADGSFKRFWRGYSKKLLGNLFNTFYFLGAVVTAVLGIYSSIIGMKNSYSDASIKAFSCTSPAG
ncbi:hypothetical protein MBLNU230_g3312t1 [Neophaeotheca triangularis]